MRAISATSWAEIDMSALSNNVAVLSRPASQANPAGVAAVVKADAYGHGAVSIANAAIAAGATRLCVFTVREAVELRESGIEAPILCLGPVLSDDPEAIARYDIAAVVESTDTARRLDRVGRSVGRTINVHINIDSGMQRYGLPRAQAIALSEVVRACRSLELEAAFTHFPDAGNADRQASLGALARFERTADQMGVPIRHAAASAATFNLPEASFDFVRAGIALYGMDPAPDLDHPDAERLRPVLSWRTTLLSIREVRSGESISYGGLWTAARDSRLGVTGVGYADGLSRRLSPGGELLVRGKRAPIRGAICMDTTMIDLTEIPDAQIGDAVTIIGADAAESISAWDLAERLETIPYEIFTGISARVPRIPVADAD